MVQMNRFARPLLFTMKGPSIFLFLVCVCMCVCVCVYTRGAPWP